MICVFATYGLYGMVDVGGESLHTYFPELLAWREQLGRLDSSVFDRVGGLS